RTDKPEHWALDLKALSPTWAARAPMLTLRNHMGAVALNGKVYAIGGQQKQDAPLVTQTAGEVYDPATDKWAAVKPLSLARSHISSATLVVNGRIVTIGGEISYNNPISKVSS